MILSGARALGKVRLSLEDIALTAARMDSAVRSCIWLVWNTTTPHLSDMTVCPNGCALGVSQDGDAGLTRSSRKVSSNQGSGSLERGSVPGVRYHSYNDEVYVSLKDLVEAAGGLMPFTGRPRVEGLEYGEKVASYLRLISAVTNSESGRIAKTDEQLSNHGVATKPVKRRRVIVE